jgi:hypothetical protein
MGNGMLDHVVFHWYDRDILRNALKKIYELIILKVKGGTSEAMNKMLLERRRSGIELDCLSIAYLILLKLLNKLKINPRSSIKWE